MPKGLPQQGVLRQTQRVEGVRMGLLGPAAATRGRLRVPVGTGKDFYMHVEWDALAPGLGER